MKEYDDYAADATTIEEFSDLLSEDETLTVELRQETKVRKAIYVLTDNPKATRRYLVGEVGPEMGIEFIVPRKTKADGYTLWIQSPSDETFLVKIKKGGKFRGGRQNELNFQSHIKSQLEQHGECHLKVTDDYGKTVELDIVDVMDSSANHGKLNRADTTVVLKDGSTYGISQKKTNATYVCKVKKLLADILFQSEKRLREYAKANGLNPGDYMDIRITNRDLIGLCWFGTDIATGAAFIGDLEDISSNEIRIHRIIENGDEDVLTSFPIYCKWLISNKAYTMKLQGVCVPSLNNKWVIDDLELPGINAPLPIGRNYKVDEDMDESQLLEESRQDKMWDTIAYCAENHKMVWLKYETVEDGNTISRRVGPYSYRTRDTKVRGRSTYFYADDFTPGEEKGIKCFLIENCLDAKESKQSFSPRFPVEIRQEIDRLERQRKDDQEVYPKKQSDAKANPKDDGVLDKDKSSVTLEPRKPEPSKLEPSKKDVKEEPKQKPEVQKDKVEVSSDHDDEIQVTSDKQEVD